MDRSNNIEEFLNENDNPIYSFFKGNLGETVYIGTEQYLVYRYVVQFISEKWSLIGKTRFNETEHIIISVTITNNEHNYSFNHEEKDYVEDILHKILSYKESIDQINNYFL
jgi:hypothetical protein